MNTNQTIDFKDIKTADELFALKYGEKGSPSRIEFESKAKAFFICEMLKEERKKAKISQSELAERTTTRKEFISRIENGKVDVQLSTLIKMLSGLNLTLKIEPI
jgi:HTH-type transcriptional regulator / antitoxin HipB